MSNWIEITAHVDGEAAEAVAEVLRRHVHQGVAIEYALPEDGLWPDEPLLPDKPLIVRAYIPADDRADATCRQIEEGLHYLNMIYPVPPPIFRPVVEEDWAEAWKQHYHPVRVGQHILVKPAWAETDIQPDDLVIEMDPGMAFGTGTHPSTQLCLKACEWFVKQGMCVLDLGTGSGILAIAAAKLGARRVIARDLDETAVRAAQENVIRNGVGKTVIVQHGSLEGLITSDRRFDLVLVNILAKTIIEMSANGLGFVMWPGCRLVASGIVQSQVEDTVAALDKAGLKLLGQEAMGDWVMLITQRRWE